MSNYKLILLSILFFSAIVFPVNQISAQTSEQRAVWLQDDVDLDNKLQKLKAAHFNTVYFGVWGAKNLGLQGVIDKVHQYGMDFHLWEANAFICAGEWLSGCPNQNNSSWFARLPNGMSRKDLLGSSESNYVDFGVPGVRDNAINYMVNYAKNYNVDGIHYDYIRYDGSGNWSFTQSNLDNFHTQYGVVPEIIRGDNFPAFSGDFGANRVSSPTIATVLATFQDSVPAILENIYKNGHVLTVNFNAYRILFKAMDTVLKRAINSYGNANIYILSAPGINDESNGGYNLTVNWLKYLGYTSNKLDINNLSTLPAGSLLIAPGVYAFTDAQIANFDTHLTNGGNIIFIDGPVTTIVRSTAFQNIVGVSGTASYLSRKGLVTIAQAAQSHPFVTGLTVATPITYDLASTYIDFWNKFMEDTITTVVKGVSDQLRPIKPNVKITGAIFTAQSNYGYLLIHQNWPEWLRNGYIDYAVPMGYVLDSKFTKNLDWFVVNNIQDHTVYGQGPYLMTDCTQKQTILDQITELRTKGFPGFSMFQSNYLTESKYIPASCGILTSLTNYFGSDVSPKYPTPLTSSPNPSPISFWKFDESSGNAAADSNSGNNGTWSGTGTHWSSGRLNNAGYFNGTDDVVSIGNPSNLNNTNEGAVSAWIKIHSWTGNDAPIIVKANTYDNTRKDWAITVGGNTTKPSLKFLLASGIGYSYQGSYTQLFYSDNIFYDTWYHVVLSWKKTDKTYMYVYVNGALNSSGSMPLYSSNYMTDTMGTAFNISLGKYAGQNLYFNGNIDELKIFNKLLTPMEVYNFYQQDLMNMVSQTPVSTPSPSPSSSPNPADIDGSGQVNAADLLFVLKNWLGLGNCSTFICDLNSDNKINALDASLVIKNWGM